MPTLEFATINLDPGVKPDDARLVSVLNTCITSIENADGVSGMRFIKNVPQGAQEQILGLVGVWASIEAHEAFSKAGKLLPLLVDLKDLIKMRGVAHLGIEELSSSQSNVLASDIVSISVSVAPSDHEKLQSLVSAALQAASSTVISGWKIKNEESFREAEETGRKGLGQSTEAEQAAAAADADPDVWVVFVPEKDTALVDQIVSKTKSLAIGDAEVQHWTST
jgi:hypothetical protein